MSGYIFNRPSTAPFVQKASVNVQRQQLGIAAFSTATLIVDTLQVLSTATINSLTVSSAALITNLQSSQFASTAATIGGGKINGTPIGATNASSANFTHVAVSSGLSASSFDSSNVNITGGSMSGVSISGYVPYTGATTSVDLNGQALVNVGHLGVGVSAAPNILIRAIGDNGSLSRIAMRGYSSDANGSAIRVSKFRGSSTSPRVPNSGDSLGRFEFAGYASVTADGLAGAYWEAITTEMWGATGIGTKVLLKVTPSGTTTPLTALTVDQDRTITAAAGFVSSSSLTGSSGGVTNTWAAQTIAATSAISGSSGSFSAGLAVSSGFSASSAAITNTLSVGTLMLTAPVTKTTTAFTVGSSENYIIIKSTAVCTVTMPTAATWTGRAMTVKNLSTNEVWSAASNLTLIDSTVASSVMLLGVVGNWATLVSDGTNWVTMAQAPNNVLLLE